MKHLIPLIFFPILLFSLESYKINDIHVVYQKSEQMYDYVSLIIHEGYLGNGDCFKLKQLCDNLRNDSASVYMKCYPDYTMIECYSKKFDAVNMLLKMRRSLDEKSLYMREYDFDLLDIAILERWGYSIGRNSDTESKSIGEFVASAGLSVFIKSSAKREELDGILKTIEIKRKMHSNLKEKKSLYGEYYLGDIPSDIYFYDFEGGKDFSLQYYLILLHSLNAEGVIADIRSLGKNYFLVTASAVDTSQSEASFLKGLAKAKDDIMISENNLSELVYRLNFLFHDNPNFKLSGLLKKISSAKYKDYKEFLASIKHDLVFRKSFPEHYRRDYDKKILKNQITLLYRNKKETGTEIAVCFSNVLTEEREWSKKYASDMIFHDLSERFPEWRSEILLPQSNLRIFSLKISEERALSSLAYFLSQLTKPDIDNLRNENIANETILNDVLIRKGSGESSEVDSSFMLLSDGEYRLISQRIFSGANVTVAVESSLPLDLISEALEKISLKKSDRNYFPGAKEEETEYIEYAFNLLNRYLTEENKIKYAGEIYQSFNQRRPYYYSIGKRNKTNILAALSDIIYSDPNKLLENFR
ncbi:MAG: hypothetical protein PHW02_01415 [bacterium]|nr:hypothetical protein [bacterium]